MSVTQDEALDLVLDLGAQLETIRRQAYAGERIDFTRLVDDLWLLDPSPQPDLIRVQCRMMPGGVEDRLDTYLAETGRKLPDTQAKVGTCGWVFTSIVPG